MSPICTEAVPNCLWFLSVLLHLGSFSVSFLLSFIESKKNKLKVKMSSMNKQNKCKSDLYMIHRQTYLTA